MAKEMLIIFVYDTEMLQKEDDDPASAILYFHPTWVSDQQKTALCGQLMGTVHCIKAIFQVPRIVSLQSGKFFVKEYGRYLLALGTDRNIPDWVLEHRATIICSLLHFFHEDIAVMGKMYEDSGKLAGKLYHLFETYLKYMFLGGNIFAYTPSLKLPKSASTVFLEAMQILQCCQEANNVLGGTLLYHNKVVATQLSANITKQIVFTDPYRIKCPAESVVLPFEPPLGVQLLYVYIPSKDLQALNEDADKRRSAFSRRNWKFPKATTSKEPVLAVMKRDQSLIFTAVPEEDTEHELLPQKTVPNRPKFLNLKPVVPITTPTVCSTPIADLTRVVFEKPMSLCRNQALESPKRAPEHVFKTQGFVQRSQSVGDVGAAVARPRSRSLCDPTCPVFTQDGRAMSRSCYEASLCHGIESLVSQIKVEAPKPVVEKRHSMEYRRALTLPLKPLSESTISVQRRQSGVLLTPLMSKLSSFDDGFHSKDATPCDYKLFTPTVPKAKPPVLDAVLHKCVLFVCGQQDMVMALLLKEHSFESSELLNRLWEICTENLGRLERQLHHCLETYPSGGNRSDNEPYSYLYLDAEWDTIQRGGPWGNAELGALSYFHRDFDECSNLTEMLMRCSDGVIYGHQCGKTQVFYHQTAGASAGLPPPSDPMSTVAIKAKRRLERDHSIILL